MAKSHKTGNRTADERKSGRELEMNLLKEKKQILKSLRRLEKAIIEEE